MVIVEVFNESDFDCVLKVAADSYESLKNNVEDKLSMKIKTFLDKKDREEIEDNDQLMEKLDLAAKKSKKLQLIAIEASDDLDDLSDTFVAKTAQDYHNDDDDDEKDIRISPDKSENYDTKCPTSKGSDELEFKMSKSKLKHKDLNEKKASDEIDHRDLCLRKSKNCKNKKAGKHSKKSSRNKNKKHDSSSSQRSSSSSSEHSSQSSTDSSSSSSWSEDSSRSKKSHKHKKSKKKAKQSKDENDQDKKSNDQLVSELLELRKLLSGIDTTKSANTKTKESACKVKSELSSSVVDENNRLHMREMSISRKIENEKHLMALKNEESNKRIQALNEEYDKVKKLTLTSLDASKTEIKKLEEQIVHAKIRQHSIAKLFKELKEAEKVDLCFMLDCTGSMSSYIREAINAIHKIIDKLRAKFQDFQLRFSFVGYRDHEDGPSRVVVLNFSDAIDKFKAFVNGIRATGGADECEDIFGGLEEVTKLDWKNMTRVLFHIGDAPCHGSRFYHSANDSHPLGDPRGLDITDLMRKIVGLKIAYYFAEINASTVKMIEEFQKELSANNGDEIRVVKLESAINLTKAMTESITRSIMDSKSLSMSEGRDKPKRILELEKVINWNGDHLTEHAGTMYEIGFHAEIDKLKDARVTYKEKKVKIKMASKPFAKGTLRYATAALININDKVEKKFVLKESIYDDAEYYSFKFMQQTVEPHLFADFLAEKFMNVSKSQKSLKFTKICIVRLDAVGRFYAAEEYFDEEFHKWSNNAGFVDEDQYSATLDSFAHWTFQATDGFLVVTDLQGATKRDEYILTDPAITCPSELLRFTRTNLGINGLKKFFQTHQCNHLCKHLKLQKHPQQIQIERDNSTCMTQLNSVLFF